MKGLQVHAAAMAQNLADYGPFAGIERVDGPGKGGCRPPGNANGCANADASLGRTAVRSAWDAAER
jgi:hypothetical protein